MKGNVAIKSGYTSNSNNYLNSAQFFTQLMNPSSKFSKTVRGRGWSIGTSVPNSASNFLKTPSKNQHSNFLYVYFWYAYILLLIPFRFKKLGEGRYKIHRWFPQQVRLGIFI